MPRRAVKDNGSGCVRARKPVIINGWLDDWNAVGKWSIDYFIEKCGDNEIRIRYLWKENDEYRSRFHETTVREWLEELKEGQKDDLYMAEAPLGALSR